jgi:hypothetical protein
MVYVDEVKDLKRQIRVLGEEKKCAEEKVKIIIEYMLSAEENKPRPFVPSKTVYGT